LKLSSFHTTYSLIRYIILLIAFVGISRPQITGSGHDLSAYNWTNGEICITCHTPHNADLTVSTAPLWNHALTTATYTLYDSHTMDENTVQPLGISKLCLGCHDGTVAVDNFGGNQNGSQYITGTANVGTDLSNDHPISIKWTHQTVGGITGLVWDNCTQCHDQIGENPEKFPLPFYTYDGGVDYYIECSTCHDPHNGIGGDYMLRMSNSNSALCEKCH